MTRIDTSCFPVGRDIDYQSPDEVEGLRALEARAWAFMASENCPQPVADLALAFGVAPMLALHLARFAPGGKPEDAERWVVVGDLAIDALRDR